MSTVENEDKKDDTSFTKKRNRKHSAQTLPNGLEHHMMKKYVVYYREWIDRSHTKEREYFKIEKHPHNINNKLYVSSKSNKVTILEKLEEIKKMLLIIEEEYELYNKNNEPQQIIKDEEAVIKDETQVSNISQNKNFSIVLPKYIAIRKHETEAHKYYLIYDKKLGSKRNTMRALCSNSTLLSTNLELFMQKIEEKFAT